MRDDVLVGGVRVVAWVRALTATGAAIAVALLPATTAHRYGLQALTGLVWVPWAGAVALTASGKAPAWLPPVAAIGDLVVVFVGSLLLEGRGDVAAPAYALVVVGAAWSGGLRLSLPVALAAITLPVLAGAVDDGAAVDPLLLGVVAVVVTAVVVALDRAAAAQSLSDARSSRLAGKSAAVLDRVAEGIVSCDGSGRVVEVNQAAARLVCTAASDMIGRPCHQVLGLHVGERRLDCSCGCALLAGPGDGVEAWRTAAGGTRQPLLVSVIGIGDGDDVEVVHSLRDITRLKQADEAKTLFLATASHELKTPLTVIAGFAQTLLHHPGISESEREYGLRAIDSRAHELTRIVDRLLLSSRIEAGRVDVTLTAVPVVSTVLERADALERATGRPVHVTVEVDEAARVLADREGLVTAVDHLLDNAVKYSPGAEPVTVHLRPVAGGGVEVAVADAGIGMDAEAVDHCFDKFWQGEAGDRRRFGGTGIGLYIVRSLVEAMGSSVSVRSAPGAGSVFTVALPPATGAEAAGPPFEGPESARAGERSMVREFMRQIGVGGGR